MPKIVINVMYQTDLGVPIRQTNRMNATIKNVDLVSGKVLVTFGDGTATMFDAEFLYNRRHDKGNEPLSPEQRED